MTNHPYHPARIDDECTIHDCDKEPEELWYAITPAPKDNIIYHALAVYCSNHSESHAEEERNLHYAGPINEVLS